MRLATFAALLALAGCGTGAAPTVQTMGSIPRDARGEPIFDALPPPPAPSAVDARSVPSPAAMAVIDGTVVTIPAAPPQLLPPGKPVSCQHFKRCL